MPTFFEFRPKQRFRTGSPASSQVVVGGVFPKPAYRVPGVTRAPTLTCGSEVFIRSRGTPPWLCCAATVCNDTESVRIAADLAAKAAVNAGLDGRPLFAANAALDWPEDPVARLWHAVTLLREHRGDAHVAVLTAAGISGRESNVLHAAAGRVPLQLIMRSRDYDDQQWALYQHRLVDRGLLDERGALTEDGRKFKQNIEDTTDRLALSALDALSDHEVETLFRVLTPITRTVVDGGDLPDATPMGLNRDDLDDDSARLS